ncbi:MAG: hypothetical protein EBU34_06140, partial [Alphaproteobacteria bacterium]|nr:hypothetical protein [Alphaproteobacteria bacterium]
MISSKIKATIRIAAIILAALVLLAGAWVIGLRLTGNIHEVEASRIFRSAQLSPAQLTELVNERGIKTILNLRGQNLEDGWYRDEFSVSEKLG